MSWAREALSRRQAFVPPTPEQLAFDNSPQILAITGTFFALAAIIVLLRCYVRIFMLRVFGNDDYMIIFAMILCTGTFACFKLRADNGIGRHLLVIIMDPPMLVRLTKVQYVESIIIMVGISAVKISIAFSLLRLSIQRLYKRVLYGAIAFISLMTIACALTLILQCLPVQAAWDTTLRPPPTGTGNAKCYNSNIFRNLGLMNSIFNIVTDILFASLPIPLIWQLQLNSRTKISLILVLSLGWFASVAAIIKAFKQWHVFEDLDWTVEDSFNVWNYIEFTIGIIAASLPTLKPFFNWFLETARAFTSNPRSKMGSNRVTVNSRGYQNKTDQWNKDITMECLPSKNTSSPTSSSMSPYHVRITAQPTGRADKEGWDAQRHSDESIIPLQPRHAVNPNGITMTREISVV